MARLTEENQKLRHDIEKLQVGNSGTTEDKNKDQDKEVVEDTEA